MEHQKLAKSHGILPISPLNCNKFVFYWSSVRNKAAIKKIRISRCFPQNAANAKSGRNMVMENQEMVMVKHFVKSVGTL